MYLFDFDTICVIFWQKQAGVEVMPLDGCVECNNFIFLPSDNRRQCPFCGTERYEPTGEPKERIWYFPIKGRLTALMKVKSFARSIDYEKRRNFNSSYIADVYDSEVWKEETQEENLSDNAIDMMDIEDDGILFVCLFIIIVYLLD